jgi:hypothetical protein
MIEDDDSLKHGERVLKGMIVKREKSKSSENEATKTPFVTVKKEYPSESSQLQYYGFDPEDSIGTSPHVGDPCHRHCGSFMGPLKEQRETTHEVIHNYSMRTSTG